MGRRIKGYWIAVVLGVLGGFLVGAGIAPVVAKDEQPLPAEVREIGVPMVVSANDKIIEATRVLKGYTARKANGMTKQDVVNCEALYDLLEAARIAYSENCPGP